MLSHFSLSVQPSFRCDAGSLRGADAAESLFGLINIPNSAAAAAVEIVRLRKFRLVEVLFMFAPSSGIAQKKCRKIPYEGQIFHLPVDNYLGTILFR